MHQTSPLLSRQVDPVTKLPKYFRFSKCSITYGVGSPPPPPPPTIDHIQFIGGGRISPNPNMGRGTLPIYRGGRNPTPFLGLGGLLYLLNPLHRGRVPLNPQRGDERNYPCGERYRVRGRESRYGVGWWGFRVSLNKKILHPGFEPGSCG